jgi:hypothetical protein
MRGSVLISVSLDDDIRRLCLTFLSNNGTATTTFRVRFPQLPKLKTTRQGRALRVINDGVNGKVQLKKIVTSRDLTVGTGNPR